MDFMTIIGLTLGFGTMYYVMKATGIVSLMINPNAAVLVFGGTIAATLITYPWTLLKQVPRAVILILFPHGQKPNKIIYLIVHLAEVSKRSGIDGLENEKDSIKERFLKDGIDMIINGLQPELIRDNLEKEISFTRMRHQQIAGIFRTMGTYAPIFGLLGTLIGVVQILRNLTDPASLGASMAIAVTTTLYGIFSTNFIFLPLAGKLNAYSDAEILLKEVIIEGILSIKAQEVPALTSLKLQAFLSHRLRESKKSR